MFLPTSAIGIDCINIIYLSFSQPRQGPQNSGSLRGHLKILDVFGDMKQVPYWGPTNVGHHHRTCSFLGDLAWDLYMSVLRVIL